MVQEPVKVESLLTQLHQLIDQHCADNDSLMGGGKLGLIVYYHSLWQGYRDNTYLDKTYALLDEVWDHMNKCTLELDGPSLATGICGLTSVINLLYKDGLLDIDIDKELAGYDDYLFHQALQLIKEDKQDYLHGAFGIIKYFTDRLPQPKIATYLREILRVLYDKCVVTKHGIWFKNIFLFGTRQINFSLSQGQAGFFSVLTALHEAEIDTQKTGFLLQQGIRFIRHHLREVDLVGQDWSFFPLTTSEAEDEKNYNNRLGWCHGDLNQVSLFYKASFVLQDENLKQMADLVGGSSLMRRTGEATQIDDIYFLNGTAGLAQYYYSLYRHSNEESYLGGWHYWINETIKRLEVVLNEESFKGRETRMLEGLPGVALVLLGRLINEELPWTDLLLL
ncbi:lanthionine synthetase LanC family protein [Chitinophaga sp.]|uniref:lanthionine synthetase LanC family protein n=1 Tax=Chitinophaga sp. TaxID=1869181 RepID=UPI0031D086AE